MEYHLGHRAPQDHALVLCFSIVSRRPILVRSSLSADGFDGAPRRVRSRAYGEFDTAVLNQPASIFLQSSARVLWLTLRIFITTYSSATPT